jgi:nitrogen regulatory protein PII
VNYAGFFAYAFVGNFLIISETGSVRRAVDAYLNHQTLASNSVFRNSRRWEPRQNLGEIYLSPAMMEGYHDAIRKQAGTMDPTMRDFILGLDPTASAITYALANEGLGTQHEIHLPKNLIITMVAGISSATKNPPPEANEMIAMSALQMISSAESTYKSTQGKGKYGSLENLVEAKLVNREFLEKYGYTIAINASDDRFEAVATPREYGKTGKRSFFIDHSGIVRGDDHGGGPATVADKPIE